MATDRQIADQAIAHLKRTTVSYPVWLQNQAHGKYPDITKTEWWQAFDTLGKIGADPNQWLLQPPRPPITRITNLAGLGLNVNNLLGGSFADYQIDGTGDSGILLQGTTSGCYFDRIELKRIAVTEAVSWAKHAVYCKARGNTFTDLYCENGGHAASSLSVRMGDNTFARTVLRGFNYVSYYEHDGKPGFVQFVDGDWQFVGDTAVWGDDSNDPPTPGIKQAFLFQNIDARGPGSVFLKFGDSSYQGSGVTIDGCTLNGQAVTAQMVSGVPANLLHIT